MRTIEPGLGECIALGRATTSFRRRWRVERLELYRRYLQCHVTQASALLASLAGMDEVDLAAAAWRMRPPVGWAGSNRGLGFTWVKGGYGPNRTGAHPGWRVDRRGELVLRRVEDPRGFLSIRPGRSLEVTAAIGGVTLTTSGDRCFLWIGHDLPAAMCVAMQGRQVREIVRHPWFERRSWPVVGVIPRRTGTTIVVATGRVPHRMPWHWLTAAAEVG